MARKRLSSTSAIPVHCAHDELKDPKTLKGNPRNPNKHPASQIALLAKVIKEHGWRAPITISRRSGYIVRGHGRLEAALKLKAAVVPVDYQDYASDVEEYADLIVDNRLPELAELDRMVMKDLFSEMKDDSYDLSLTGFADAEVSQILDLSDGGVGQEDEVPDLPKKSVTKVGDLWELGDHRLLCGDSTIEIDVRRIIDGVVIGVLLVDPPYGIDLDADYSGMKNKLEFAQSMGVRSGRKYENVIGDDRPYDAAALLSVWPDVAAQYWFGADYYASTLPDTEHAGAWLVWDKRLDESADKMFGSCFELIWASKRCKRAVLRHKWAGIFGTEKEPIRGRVHPTQKPIRLICDLITRAGKPEFIGDPYCGSGSAFIAAEQLSRRCYGLEISPLICDVIVERWENLTGKKAKRIRS